MNIYLIRHGRQNSKLCNVDVELNEIGRRQANLVGKRLANYDIDVIYSSHYLRAYETAKIINSYLNVEHFVNENLREIDFGDLQGNTDDYINKYFKDFKSEREAMISDIAFPNGENGQDVLNRIMPILESIINSNYKNIVIVTHGGVIRSILTYIAGAKQNNKLRFAQSLENCSISQIFYKEQNKKFYIERFNDYAHLEIDKKLLRKNWSN